MWVFFFCFLFFLFFFLAFIEIEIFVFVSNLVFMIKASSVSKKNATSKGFPLEVQHVRHECKLSKEEYSGYYTLVS